ncbi:hypothetical protein [Niveibacterium sp. SC-1]|uniref:hypothetical protein n=1 Tax=Niveibacterium sp. SC-1 TaxID=3135646 RepID=UPI00311F2F1E
MALTSRTFRIGLYLEHLDEASFLYDQCRALRKQADFAWRSLLDFEDRLEAHIDALMIGNTLALEVCSKRVPEAEPGELYAAVSVFCRAGLAQEFSRTLAGLEDAPPARRRALVDALSRELPAAWSGRIGAALAQAAPPLLQILAAIVANRRIPLSRELAATHCADSSAATAVARALGRLNDPEALTALDALAQRPEVAVRREVLTAQLALGSTEAARTANALAPREPWAGRALALSGDGAACAALTSGIEKPDQARSAAISLGLLGDLRGVRPLARLLEDKANAAWAAWGLYLITGAPLFGQEFVPDAVHEDEMNEQERHAWREHGAVPQRGDGRTFGGERSLLSTSGDVWNDWLRANAARFEAGRRYRLGELVTPASTLKTLLEPQMPDEIRQAAADEIRIRYQCELPFESDMPVRQQLRVLRGLSRWTEQHASSFELGRWYFGGRPIG